MDLSRAEKEMYLQWAEEEKRKNEMRDEMFARSRKRDLFYKRLYERLVLGKMDDDDDGMIVVEEHKGKEEKEVVPPTEEEIEKRLEREKFLERRKEKLKIIEERRRAKERAWLLDSKWAPQSSGRARAMEVHRPSPSC